MHAPASLDGAEIEIRRRGEPWAGRHVAVRARHLPAGVIYAAVFESLVCGGYEVRIRVAIGEPRCTFEVEGGRVTEEHLEA